MLLTERYKEQIAEVVSCYDRLVIQGTLPGWCFAGGMTSFLKANNLPGGGTKRKWSLVKFFWKKMNNILQQLL